MLGGGNARGYCLEMICADFLAGVGVGTADSELLLIAIGRLFEMLPASQKNMFAEQLLTAS